MRTSVAATLVVTVCLVLAGAALLFVLFRTLETSARAGRECPCPPGGRRDCRPGMLRIWIDRCWLPTARWAAVQVVDSSGRLVAQSTGSPSTPLSRGMIAPGESEFLGQVEVDAETTTGSPASGPIPRWVRSRSSSDLVARPVEEVVATVGWLLAVGGPIVVALVAFGTYRLVGSALQPVERMRARVSSLTSAELHSADHGSAD